VVIPTRNRAALVAKAIASVQRQTWPAWEGIVVDDASVDETLAVLGGIAERDPRVRVVRHEHSEGGSAARNTGVELARGNILAFLDDDDEWLPTKLAEQLAYLDAHREVGAVSCWHAIDDGTTLGPALFRGPTAIALDDLYWDNFTGSASFCVLRRDAFTREPRFDAALPSAQDWDVWLQCAAQARVAVVPQVLCRYGAHLGPRITGSSPARIDGRRRIVERHVASMSDDCRAYNEASLALIGVESPAAEAKVLAGLVRDGHRGAAWALTSAALAGRIGDRARDPGRGPRQLHRVVQRLRERT
jgi:glycosyltransferase involved in cell wall biosynthesis